MPAHPDILDLGYQRTRAQAWFQGEEDGIRQIKEREKYWIDEQTESISGILVSIVELDAHTKRGQEPFLQSRTRKRVSNLTIDRPPGYNPLTCTACLLDSNQRLSVTALAFVIPGGI